MLLDDARARREHAVGVVRPVDVDPVGRQHRPLDVVEQRRGVRLDRANEVERAGLERFDRFGSIAHVADGYVTELHSILFEPVVRQYFKGIIWKVPRVLPLSLAAVSSPGWATITQPSM